MHLVDVPLGVLRPGQLLAEGVQAEPGVDALVQYAARLAVPLQYQNIPHALVIGADGGRQPGRAAAYDSKLYFLHHSTSLVRPASRRLSPPPLVNSVMGTCSSRLSSSMTFGPQKPP